MRTFSFLVIVLLAMPISGKTQQIFKRGRTWTYQVSEINGKNSTSVIDTIKLKCLGKNQGFGNYISIKWISLKNNNSILTHATEMYQPLSKSYPKEGIGYDINSHSLNDTASKQRQVTVIDKESNLRDSGRYGVKTHYVINAKPPAFGLLEYTINAPFPHGFRRLLLDSLKPGNTITKGIKMQGGSLGKAKRHYRFAGKMAQVSYQADTFRNVYQISAESNFDPGFKYSTRYLFHPSEGFLSLKYYREGEPLHQLKLVSKNF
jgi:hypothetical protein